MRKAIFKMNRMASNEYERDLQKLNGNTVTVRANKPDENGLYEVIFEGGNEYDVFQDELIMQ